MSRHRSALDQIAVKAGRIVHSKLSNHSNEDELCSELAPLEEAAARERATTARGALFQLLVAAADLGELVGTNNSDEEALHERNKRIEGCVLSALALFERRCGLDRDEIGGEYFARRGYVAEAWRRSEC